MSLNDLHITFIIPESCDDESQTSPKMQETYSLCKQNRMEVSWLRETDGDCLDMQKTEIIVFQEFAGALFEKAAEAKSVVLGPSCLMECLSEPKQIPNVEWPLFNLTMENCVVVCSNLGKEIKHDIRQKVRAMGGQYTISIIPTNTHLITNTVCSEKYNAAVRMGLRIMLSSWVNDVWESSQTKLVDPNSKEFDKHKCPPFHNLIICATGFSNHDEISKLVKENGGKFNRNLVLKSTDVLICKSTSGDKYRAARKQKITCVSMEWLLDCIEKGYCIADSNNYPVKKATSTPTKSTGDESVDPNFSMMSAIASSHNSTTRSVLQETMCSQFASPHLPPPVTKRKGTLNYSELIDNIDIKRVKRAEAFLDGCCLYLTGFTSEQHDKLVKVVNFSGAQRVDTLSERITHIVVGDTSGHEVKLIRTKNIPCPMVSVKWVIDSIEKRQPASEEEYLVSAISSPSADHGSPLIKKGLRLLKTDMSILENEEVTMKNTEVQPQIDEEEANANENIMMQYMRNSFAITNQEDTLAAALAMNKFDTKQHITTTEKSKQSVTPSEETTVPTVTISMEETNTTICLENLKFLVANFPFEQEQEIKSQIAEMGGTVVSKQYKSIPDYAIVPVTSTEFKYTVENLVTDLWWTEVYERRAIVDIMYYHKPCMVTPCEVLQGVVLSMSGFTYAEKCFLKDTAEMLGAIVQDSLARVAKEPHILASTHLLCAEGEGKKYEAAVKWGLPVLDKEWILECARVQKLVPLEEYLLGNSRESYGRDNSKLRNSSRLNISVNSPARESPLNISKRTPGEHRGGNENVKVTPLHKRILQKEMGSGCSTPANVSTYCSQITPVNQIMKNAQIDLGMKTPVTPKPWDHVDTPETPLGAAFCDGTPPPELRKKFLRWIDGFPEYEPKPRRLSTPLSELKRQLWNRVCPEYSAEEIDDKQMDIETDQSPEGNVTPDRSEDTTGNEVVGEKLKQLQSMLQASASSRRSSIKKQTPPVLSQPYVRESVQSQPFSVGWDDNMESNAVQKKNRLFMLSGVDVDEREKMLETIENLGGKVSELQNYDPASTHLLCPKLNRNEKLLASMAAGKWVLHVSYVEDSLAAGQFLDEEEYEYGNPKCNITVEKDCEQRAICSHKWRKEISKRGYGAFHDVRAIVVASKREPMIRVIEAGGGMVVDLSPPFEDNIFATHCFVEVKKVENIKDYIPLAQQGIQCLNTLYVNEFLHKNVRDYKDYIVPGLKKYYS